MSVALELSRHGLRGCVGRFGVGEGACRSAYKKSEREMKCPVHGEPPFAAYVTFYQ